MDSLILLVDFGSTFTKVIAANLEKEVVLGRSQSPTTVQDNLLSGLQNALASLSIEGLKLTESDLKKCRKLACSSAAGGLRLITIGLVPELTLEAAKRAALGAGAKVVGSFSHELTGDDISRIEQIGCDIILLSGGTDGGNKKVILHNSRMLAESKLDVPFIIAGNRVAVDRAREILETHNKYAEITENVLPELDRINVEPARGRIRDIFMKRIVHARGLDRAQEFIGDIIMPTPLATLKAAQLLADGIGREPGFGELIVVEVGGATTNVHSVSKGDRSGRTVKGLPEPYAKRTVEGDLGIRYNAATIVEMLGLEKVGMNFPETVDCSKWDILKAARRRSQNVGFVPSDEQDFLIDMCLAKSAVEVAVERHAGIIKEMCSPYGVEEVQYGKDLTGIKTIIGTGGVFAYNRYPGMILEAALFNRKNPLSLKPLSPVFYTDQRYIIYGIGLLSESEPAKALRIARKYLHKFDGL